MICIEIQLQGLILIAIVKQQEDTNICMFDFHEEAVPEHRKFLYYKVVAESTENLLRPVLYRPFLEQSIHNEDDCYNLIREVENMGQTFLMYEELQTWKVIPCAFKDRRPNFNFSTKQ
jgi:hypothetical protein